MQDNNVLEEKFKNGFKKPSAFSSQIRGTAKPEQSKNATWIIAILIILAIFIIGYYFLSGKKVEQNTVEESDVETPEGVVENTEEEIEEVVEEPVEEEPAEEETPSDTDWKTYENKDWAISFHYTGSGVESKVFDNPAPQNPYEARLQYRVNSTEKDDMVVDWTVWENKGKLTLKGFFDEFLLNTVSGCDVNSDYTLSDQDVIRVDCKMDDTYSHHIVIFTMDSKNKVYKVSYRSKNDAVKQLTEEAIKSIKLS